MKLKKRTVTLQGKKFILGDEYKDTLLDIKGVATAGITYLTGCDQLELKFKDTDGCANAHWCDVTIVEKVKPEKKPTQVRRVAGGPPPNLKRQRGVQDDKLISSSKVR